DCDRNDDGSVFLRHARFQSPSSRKLSITFIKKTVSSFRAGSKNPGSQPTRAEIKGVNVASSGLLDVEQFSWRFAGRRPQKESEESLLVVRATLTDFRMSAMPVGVLLKDARRA